jgi:hypothetical protein
MTLLGQKKKQLKKYMLQMWRCLTMYTNAMVNESLVNFDLVQPLIKLQKAHEEDRREKIKNSWFKYWSDSEYSSRELTNFKNSYQESLWSTNKTITKITSRDLLIKSSRTDISEISF